MKKIGIVTIFDKKNIGNRLQNYALHYYIANHLGYETETLVSFKNKKPVINPIVIYYLANCLSKVSKLARKRVGGRQTRYLKIQKWNKKIPTRFFYASDHIPECVDDEYSFFLAGSDQIWNHMFSSQKFPDYFLEFASPEKRNAIAASIGNNALPDQWKDYYKERLEEFNKLSVRENEGAHIINDLLGLNVPVLIDPTMALTRKEWHDVSRKPKGDLQTPYILTYILSHDLNSVDRDIINQWKKKDQYKVYEIMGEDRSWMNGVGPAEFLYLIENAALVFTDSFHGTIFSILFHTPFIVFKRQEYQMESRINTLLNNMGLQNRKVYSGDDSVFTCDFTEADINLEIQRNAYKEYLINELNDYDSEYSG